MTLHERIARLPDAARERLAAQLGVRHPGSADVGSSTATLVAYYVARSGIDIPTDDLRAFLGRSLPAHLVPHRFHRIDEVPRTRHGKVDTSALPDPAAAPAARAPDGSAASSALEEALLTIWRSVLGVKRLDRRDSFFELGGDSLLAIRLLGQIRERWNIDLALADLFDAPTVAGAAAQIEAVLWARGSRADGRATPSEAGSLQEEEF